MSQEQNVCRHCNGTGMVNCEHCEGTGWTTQTNPFSIAIFGFPTLESRDCYHCDGSGKKTCSYCNGTGKSDK